MRIYADLHVHSKYSRATSKDMDIETMARYGGYKGITLLGTGDFTHPHYFLELKAQLESNGSGLFVLKNKKSAMHFMLTTEVSNVYQYKNQLRRIHTLIFVPSFEAAEKINSVLSIRGKLHVDGRPVFGFSAEALAAMVFDAAPDAFLVPAHAWTPWFSVFGAHSGFNSLEECFGKMASSIKAIETGLSSDPAMNWRVSSLDGISCISNSDAHSPRRIGREANVLDTDMSYWAIIQAIVEKNKNTFLQTLEFFPEEGKYHYDGHRNCNVLFAPEDSRRRDNICPVCKKKLTIGVMHRVEELADREVGFIRQDAIPFEYVIPLDEIISECLAVGVDSKAVREEYLRLIHAGTSEFHILLDASFEELSSYASPFLVEGIMRVRERRIAIIPGHDGVYGTISIFSPDEKNEGSFVKKQVQGELF
jgi:uncharacterized protein (TIGR00375 family)